MNTYPREIAHGLQEHGHGAEVFAEGAIVAEEDGENDTQDIIDDVPDDEQAEKDFVRGFSEVIEYPNEYQRKRKHNVSDETQLLSGTLWLFVGQQVENHGRPAGIAAPAPTEKQRSEDFGDEVVDRCSTKNTGSQIEPEALNLHVLLAYKAKEDKHIQTDGKLNKLSCVFLSRRTQSHSDADANADIGEVQQEEEISRCQPHTDSNCFEDGEENDGGLEFFHIKKISAAKIHYYPLTASP